MSVHLQISILAVSLLVAYVFAQCGEVIEENECHHIIEDEENTISDCLVTRCSDDTAVNTTNLALGRATFLLDPLPSRCNVSHYNIVLRVRSDAAAADCSTSDAGWQTHSSRNIFVTYCRRDDTACRNKSPKCKQKHEVEFGYVYSGWYQLKVTPHVGTSTRQAQRSRPVQLSTAYVPASLNQHNTTVPSLQYRYANRESIVSFLFSRDLDWGETNRFHVTLRLVSQVAAPADGQRDDCYTSGEERACCDFHKKGGENRSVTCTTATVGGITQNPTCSSTGKSVQCLYHNVTPGAYCGILTISDDRCDPYTVWTQPDNKPCKWHVYKEFGAEDTVGDLSLLAEADGSGTVYAVVGAVIAVVLVVAALVFIHKYRTKRRQRVPTTTVVERATTQHRYTADERHFTFINQLTLTERPRPEVLLVYCRDSKPFVELVTALRNVLNKICKCQVYDYYDEALWDFVSEDPEGWVRELIMEREAKVVIVVSRGAAMAQRAQPLKYRNPHALDHLFPLALKLVRDHASDDSYRRHFVITFDGYTDSAGMVEHLNPYTRFVLPKHLNKLFEHLHDSNATVHFDTSRKLEEREEVRQLRLRLEHLKNLNLLHTSTNENEQIYDW